jgi:hypothetical protein
MPHLETKNRKEGNIMKLIEGAIYNYKGESVRFRKEIGAVSLLSRRKKSGFLGRTDLLKKANKTQVAKFLK